MSEPSVPEYQAATVKVEFPADDPDVPVVYANNVGVTFGPHDITLHFSWFAVPSLGTPPPDGSDIVANVRLVSKISIPLTIARPFADLLRSQAEAWEATFRKEIPNMQANQPERNADEARSIE